VWGGAGRRRCVFVLKAPVNAPFPFTFPFPPGLVRLIASGVWPSRDGPSMIEQQSRPIVPAERVRVFADDESLICLARPPFRSVAQAMAAGGSADFWQKFGALHQITPEAALIIGDFGLGSDSPIVLDYGISRTDPPVRRLRWHQGGKTEWVTGAANFDEFAAMLRLDARGTSPRPW